MRAKALAIVLWTWGLSADEGYRGVARDTQGKPVAGAVVRAQGSDQTTRTDEQGRFLLPPARGTGRHITAWAPGYYNGGVEAQPGFPLTITLEPLPAGDHPDYAWLSPHAPPGSSDPDATMACETCHRPDRYPVMREWERSAHATAATNPVFLDFFNGTQGALPLRDGVGYKRDFPHSSGNCATCHVPALALRLGFAADPNQAEGVERLGVFCDFCHKVADVAEGPQDGRAGVLSMTLSRPPPGTQVFFGPYDDVFPGPDSFNPLYRQSRYCAPCHQARFWDVAVYSEFDEWARSGYARRGQQCQACHMKPDGRTTHVALPEKGAIERAPHRVASHSFPGIHDHEFLRESVKLTMVADADDEGLTVDVTVANTGAGHHVPTGNPMRNLVLLVEARASDGTPLSLAAGDRLPAWAGVGDAALGNFGALPGRGYAKVLKALIQYPADGGRGSKRAPLYPAPHWRPSYVEADTRIAAEATDTGRWRFEWGEAAGPATASVRLIYRRTFRTWTDADRPAAGDVELAQSRLSVDRPSRRRGVP